MTQKVFWEDPYLTELDTIVTDVQGADIKIERTIFYAFSGGQESDTGTIGGYPVSNARKSNGDIIYTLAAAHGLQPGHPVKVIIDWGRRFRLMRLHLAAEIVLELIRQSLDSIQKAGAHIGEDKARIDFIWPSNMTSIVQEIQIKANALICANMEILSDYSNRYAQERFWEIRGFAKVPCGGTHLHSTGEIGEVELQRRNPGRGKERVEIALVREEPTRVKP